jgi:hypothetical protein
MFFPCGQTALVVPSVQHGMGGGTGATSQAPGVGSNRSFSIVAVTVAKSAAGGKSTLIT